MRPQGCTLAAALVASFVIGTGSANGQGTGSGESVFKIARPNVVTIKTSKGSGSGFVVNVTPVTEYSKGWREAFGVCLKELGIGTSTTKGAIADKTFIVTAYHVVANAQSIEIIDSSGHRSIPSLAYGYDEARDIAVLVVNSRIAEGLCLADYSRTNVGATVFVVGNPLGLLEDSMTAGILSAKRTAEDVPLIQFNAPISPGNSGGPVLNDKGEVIGMVLATIEDGQALNFGLASPIIKAALCMSKPSSKPSDFPLPSTRDKPIRSDSGGSSSVSGWPEAVKKAKYSGLVATIVNRGFAEFWKWILQYYDDISEESFNGSISLARLDSFTKLFPGSPSEFLPDGGQIMANTMDRSFGSECLERLHTVRLAALDYAKAEGRVFFEWQRLKVGAGERLDEYDELRVSASERFLNALQELHAFLLKSPYFSDAEYLTNLLEPVLMIVHGPTLDGLAHPDFAFTRTARIGYSTSSSVFRKDDVILGVRLASADEFMKIAGWRSVVEWFDKTRPNGRVAFQVRRGPDVIIVYGQYSAADHRGG